MVALDTVQDLINRYFPPASHPYRQLEASIRGRISPQFTVLEIGCGRGAPTLQQLRGKAARLIGIDLVPFSAPRGDIELYNASAESMPMVASGTVDFAFSRSVMEHLEHPEKVLAEVWRVLRPGGTYMALTPSLWDYASLIAYFVPNRFHPKIVKFAEGRAEIDTFPTFYRANTRRAVYRLARAANLELKSFQYLGQYPNYFAFNRFLFRLGCYYELFLMRYNLLHPLLGWTFYELGKPLSADDGAGGDVNEAEPTAAKSC